MQSITDDGLVLRTFPYAETDGIVVILSRSHGKIRGMAHGLKRLRSRFHGILSPFNLVEFSWRGSGPDRLGRYLDAALVRGINTSELHVGAYYFLSYITEIMLDMELDPETSGKCLRLIEALERVLPDPTTLPTLVPYFQFWILRLEGQMPDPDHCAGCGTLFEEASPTRGFDPSETTFFCESCSSGNRELKVPGSDLWLMLKGFRSLPPDRIPPHVLLPDLYSSVITGLDTQISNMKGKSTNSYRLLCPILLTDTQC